MAEPDPQIFWGEVLSRDPARIRAALKRLPERERAKVEAHLRRMASEPGWQEGQRAAARAALKAVEETEDP
jgi:hypothetical protein